MSEIGFGIGVRTMCLILDVTSAELPTDLLAHVRHAKIVYLNTRRNDINFMYVLCLSGLCVVFFSGAQIADHH